MWHPIGLKKCTAKFEIKRSIRGNAYISYISLVFLLCINWQEIKLKVFVFFYWKFHEFFNVFHILRILSYIFSHKRATLIIEDSQMVSTVILNSCSIFSIGAQNWIPPFCKRFFFCFVLDPRKNLYPKMTHSFTCLFA